MSALYVAGYAIIRVPFWFGVGLLNGLLDIVPGLGAIIGLGIAELACFAAKDHYHMRHGWVLALWLIVQTFENVVVVPRLMGRHLGLSSLVVFGTLIAGSLFFGPIGLLISVPIVAVANVFLRYYLDRRERQRVAGSG